MKGNVLVSYISTFIATNLWWMLGTMDLPPLKQSPQALLICLPAVLFTAIALLWTAALISEDM